MNKKVGLYNFNNAKEIIKCFAGKDIDFIIMEKLENYENFDLIITNDCIKELYGDIINIHPSLLPAYNGENAIINAFNDGVKVSGITIHSKDKIIAQYPILIGLETHIDDFIKELNKIEKKLLPPVIESILNDKVFDFNDLFSSPCHKGNCSGCNNCH